MSHSFRQIAEQSAGPAKLTNAKSLASAASWRLLGADDDFLWGECRGTTADWYQVVFDITSQSSFCSCPSRPKPCKHVLALLLLADQGGDAFSIQSQPPEWLQTLTVKKASKTGKLPPLPDRARLDGMRRGLEDLRQWLQQVISQGLAIQESTKDSWDHIAARMVDAKMGGIARRIRLLKAQIGESNWPEIILGGLAELYLACMAFENWDNVPPAQQFDLLTMAGFNIRKEDVLAGKPVRDRWLVVGQRFDIEEKLNARRTWLLGETTHKIALQLDFAWGNTPFQEEWQMGHAYKAAFVFYPSAFPLRVATLECKQDNAPFKIGGGCEDFSILGQQFATAIAANPWLPGFPVLLDNVIPAAPTSSTGWGLVDQSGHFISLQLSAMKAWQLLATSGGRPIQLFGEWNGTVFSAQSAFAENQMVDLSARE